ncbi:Fis family transcriptional regulator [Yersinia nurmii]|uniref:Fis family transcriptional regulator n=1 Tax=Yersinia nurmii TaxID=685706 RepID=A0AAW7KAH9_9GAMM|nr:Fis family transcriptional regulator [Yersinia nurmii]MDN0088665.1 Fis family transcriptional regulator [Yersinia nurmii]
MKQRLKSVLALLDNDTIEQLIHHFLQVNHRRQRFDALLVTMLNVNESRLDCYSLPRQDERATLKLDVKIDEVNHPLVQVLRNGVPAVWDSLQRGVRIENADFRSFVQELPSACGLYALPLFNYNGQACGVVAVFAENIEHYTLTNGMFSIYCHIFQHRLNKLQELEQQRAQLRQIREVFKAQQQRQKQLDELLFSLSTSDNSLSPAGLSNDYSKIDDLTEAVEEFECTILRQRQRMYGSDKKRIAASLNMAPRTLAYKLAKYRCQL